MLQFKGPQRVGHDLVSEQHQQFLNDLRHSKRLDIQGLLSPAWCLFHTTTAPCIMIYMCIYSLCTTTCAPGLPRLHSVKKNLPASAGNAGDTGLIPGLGRSL